MQIFMSKREQRGIQIFAELAEIAQQCTIVKIMGIFRQVEVIHVDLEGRELMRIVKIMVKFLGGYSSAFGMFGAGGTSFYRNCQNFAYLGDSPSRGLVGLSYGKVRLIGCTTTEACHFVAYTNASTEVDIIDCQVQTNGRNSCFVRSWNGKKMTIRNCTIEMSQSKSDKFYVSENIFSGTERECTVDISNISVKMNNTKQVFIIYWNNKACVVNGTSIKNLLITTSFLPSSQINFKNFKYANGILCYAYGRGGYFYGDDFSVYFVNRKKGYIGLKTLEDAGVYGICSIDRNYLISQNVLEAT